MVTTASQYAAVVVMELPTRQRRGEFPSLVVAGECRREHRKNISMENALGNSAWVVDVISPYVLHGRQMRANARYNQGRHHGCEPLRKQRPPNTSSPAAYGGIKVREMNDEMTTNWQTSSTSGLCFEQPQASVGVFKLQQRKNVRVEKRECMPVNDWLSWRLISSLSSFSRSETSSLRSVARSAFCRAYRYSIHSFKQHPLVAIPNSHQEEKVTYRVASTIQL